MKKHLFLIFGLFLFLTDYNAQSHYNTFLSDNYAGPFGNILQPASLADNRYKWAVGLGGNYSYSNNYIGNNFNNYLYGSKDKSAYKRPVYDGYYAELIEVVPITAFLEITPKDAIGYSWRLKRYTNFDGIEDELSRMDYNSFTDGNIIGTQFNQGRLSYARMEWAEHNLTYSRTVVDKKDKFMKAGVTVKILNGLKSRYLFTEGGDVTFNANDQLTFNGMEVQYGEHDEQDQLTKTNLGLGLDLGFVYEFRPKYKTFYYPMDRRRKNPSTHKNKYKFKVGASITNIGGIRYTKDTNSYNFINDNNNTINYKDLFNTKLSQAEIRDKVLPNVTNNQAAEDTNFRMSLPTALNLQFDYQILPNIYLNYTGSFPLWSRSDPSKVHDLITNTVSGRYETPNWAAGLPVTLQRNGQVNVGLYGRFKYVFFGANNINNLFGQRRVYNANVYAGVIVGRLHKKPKDTDGDLTSDPLDLCPTDSGSNKLKGCPDADGDRIPDYKDFCPFSPGPKKYNGCPDTDKDGILDYEDQCPYKKGLKVNKGCPDSDKDGIIDTVDRCPTIPGVYENNGCPLEPLVCCLDSDGDGLNDEIDSCRYEKGPAENNGCPTSTPTKKRKKKDKTKYPKIKKQSFEEKLEDKKVEITKMTVKEVLEDMTTIDLVNVYFGVDKAVVQNLYYTKLDGFADKVNQQANTVILILGHTDSDGDSAYNLKLSNRRSEATKKYLISKGVDPSRIVIKNYGEEKPAEENTTSENKSKNRRVEVRMMTLQ